MSFPRYPRYKDSGVEWLGDVPEHWSVEALRRRASLNPSKSEIAHLERDLSVSFLPMEAVGENGQLDLERTRQICEVEVGYTYFRDGDVTFAKITPCFENGKGARMRGLVGGIGFGSTELTVLRPLPSALDGPFMDWVLRSHIFRDQGEASMYGAGGQKRVPDEFVRTFIFAFPRLAEQIVIAHFLHSETTKIDALIEEQQRLIELLKEKRQALISQAVTKGLDPSVPMEDSGVEWLGQVPAHWNLAPLKSVATFASGGTPDKRRLDYWDGDIPWASAKDLKVDMLFDTIDHISPLALSESASSLVPSGSILVVVRGMILARIFPVVTACVPMAINQDLKSVRACAPNQNEWLAWLLRASAPETLNRLDEAGHGTKALRMEAWASMKVPVPALQEQKQIAAYLETACAQLDALITESEHTTSLLTERRSALISAAVTGKIDVRGFVPAQPGSVAA